MAAVSASRLGNKSSQTAVTSASTSWGNRSRQTATECGSAVLVPVEMAPETEMDNLSERLARASHFGSDGSLMLEFPVRQ